MRPTSRLEAALIVVIGLWAAFQNLWNLGGSNVTADENAYARAGWAYVHGDLALNREHPFTAKYLMGLAQALFGEGVESARIAAAIATLAGGVIIWAWLRIEAGPWAAIIAAATWLLLPGWIMTHWGPRFGRFALLEPFMIMFLIVAAAAGWRWYNSRGVVSMTVSAVALSLAVTSKMSAIVVAPVIALFPAIRYRDRTAIRQFTAFTAIVVAIALVTYLPGGSPFSLIDVMMDYQLKHNSLGHRIEVAGLVTSFPPWWANPAWLAAGVGALATICLAGGAVLTLLRFDMLICYVTSILFALAAFYCLASSVALPHYYAAFLPWVCILTGLGLTLPWRSPSRFQALVVGTRIVAVTCVMILTISCVTATFATLRLHPFGVARVQSTLADLGLPTGPLLVTGISKLEWVPYLSNSDVVKLPSNDFVGIVIHRGWLRDRPDPRIVAMVDESPGSYERIDLDQVELYVPRALLPPS